MTPRNRRPNRADSKVQWSGRLLGVQPRIRLLRSFDQREHSYLGYVLSLDGIVGEVPGRLSIAVGPTVHEKQRFHRGMAVSGRAQPVADDRRETAAYYKASGIRMGAEDPQDPSPATPSEPPFHGVPPALPTYRERGHRRLDTRTYDAKCSTCIWGCRMPVEMIVDHWDPSHKEYRFETFCYGPKSCPLYRPGPTRKVPGRRGMRYEEEDWVDQEATAHRGPDE